MTNPDDLATRLHALATRVGRGRLSADELDQLDELLSLFNGWSRRRRITRGYSSSDAVQPHVRAQARKQSKTDKDTHGSDVGSVEGDQGTRNLPASPSASACTNDARAYELRDRAPRRQATRDHGVTTDAVSSTDDSPSGYLIRRSELEECDQ